MTYPAKAIRPLASVFAAAGGVAALSLLFVPAHAAGASSQAQMQQGQSRPAQTLQARLPGHVPSALLARSRLLGRVAAAQTLHLALTLPLRNQAALTDLIRRQSTPGDPLCGHFLSTAEFAAQFGPTQSDYDAAAAAARKLGFTVTGTHPNRLILDVSGPASAAETAFNLHLQRYLNPTGREFYAPDAGPLLPSGLAGRVSGVIGLNNAVRLRSHLRPALRPSVLNPRYGTGPEGGLSPSDIKNAYSLHSGATGAGQAIALFELDGYTPSDVAAYDAYFSLPAIPIQNILLGGAAGDGADEVTLDIELAEALAPGVSKILVYETPNTDSDVISAYSRIATDNIAKQISTSWGFQEDGTSSLLSNSENSIFQEMAAQGQSIMAATADNGAYDDKSTLSVDDPGSQPYVTGVGGTTLATNGTGGPYSAETAWGLPYNINDLNSTNGSAYGVGGGGGFSTYWPAPSYQSGLPLAPAMRSVPDVALNSDPETGYSIYYGGTWNVYGGTSAAAPLWAGFTALVNQQRAAAGKSAVGFLNPPIYQIGASAAYSANFHDVVSGNNLYFLADTGYDNATGWGSFVGDALLSTLVNGLAAAQTATLTGTITAADTGAVLPNVTVRALSASGNVSVAAATTDAGGAYALTVPAAAALSVTVSAYSATGGQYAGAKVSVAAVSAGQTASTDIALQPAHTFGAGLQMISSPYDYSAVGSFAALFDLSSAASSGAARLVAWNPLAGSYVFSPVAPATTLTPGRGYWVNFPSASYPHFDGALVPATGPFSLAVSSGWNLIGDPFPAAVPLSSITVNGAALASSGAVSPALYRYDTPSGQYATVNAASDSLQPYAGYWLYASQSATLSIPAP